MDTLVSPGELVALAKEADGQHWDYPVDPHFATIKSLFSSREMLVASFGRAALPASTSGKDDEGPQVSTDPISTDRASLVCYASYALRAIALMMWFGVDSWVLRTAPLGA